MTAVILGFVISAAIAMTGVGAGTLTTPLLMLLLGIPAAECVGTSLIFGAVVKLITAPLYWARGQVNWRALAYLLATGLPGVLAGSLVLQGVKTGLMMAVIGFTIMTIALLNLFKFSSGPRADRSRWLALVGLPIGAEVGFSSAGSGSLGALALLSLTPLSPAEVVGTDLCFGLALSLVGGGIHAALGSFNGALVVKLLIGGLPGAITGSILAARVPSKKFRYALSMVMVVLGAQICWKGLVSR
jgi:uncharacterized membrane protein YfcA